MKKIFGTMDETVKLLTDQVEMLEAENERLRVLIRRLSSVGAQAVAIDELCTSLRLCLVAYDRAPNNKILPVDSAKFETARLVIKRHEKKPKC